MKNRNSHIEKFNLSSKARAGVYIAAMQDKNNEEHDISIPHRDNHCQLMFATSGKFKLNIDFNSIEFNTPTLLFVFPEQVHHIIEAHSPEGWIVNFDSSVVNKELFQLMENKMNSPLSLEKATNLFQQVTTLMALIEETQSGNTNKFSHKATHDLLNALFNLIIGDIITRLSDQSETINRGIMIKDAFNRLVKQHFKTWKQPAQYAAALAISVAHLNDTVKGLTGSPASNHIQETSILEAKRLLYFTDNSVKEIAYEVGYNEPVYFGKLFKKLTNLTPLEFRKQFRD